LNWRKNIDKMALKRPIALAAVAVVLLLCLTSAAAADTQDVKGIDADQFNAKADFAMSADAAAAAQPKTNTPDQAAAAELPLKSAAAAEPQHAPQFPEDPQELKRKSQPAAPTPADSASKEAPKQQQQQPAATPTPAAEAPKEDPKQEEKEKEDPCARVPGCLKCTPFDPNAKSSFGAEFGGAMRRLAQHKGGFDGGEWGQHSIGTLGSSKSGKKGKPDFNFMTGAVDSPYNAKDLPTCSSCNTTAGYVNHSRGRCGE
jgi:hypothetical protein